MKSILVNDDIHYLIKSLALIRKSSIKYMLYEAIIDIAKKYKIVIPQSLKTYEVNNE